MRKRKVCLLCFRVYQVLLIIITNSELTTQQYNASINIKVTSCNFLISTRKIHQKKSMSMFPIYDSQSIRSKHSSTVHARILSRLLYYICIGMHNNNSDSGNVTVVDHDGENKVLFSVNFLFTVNFFFVLPCV